MKRSVILVGEDKSLLQTRASKLSNYFRIITSSAQGAVNVLSRAECDMLLLCESIAPATAAFLIFSIRCQFPLVTLVRLERKDIPEMPLYFQADYVVHTSDSSTQWMDDVKRAFSGRE